MRMIAFLRAVMPTGKNRIPKMSYLAEIVSNAGYKNVRTYIQSGNIILDTEKDIETTEIEIHTLIKEHIGADLTVIVKTAAEVTAAIEESPSHHVEDYSSVFFVWTNQPIDAEKKLLLSKTDWGMQKIFFVNTAFTFDCRGRQSQNA